MKHKRNSSRSDIKCPCLGHAFTPNQKSKKWHKYAQTSDVILDVKHIDKYAKKIKGDVTLSEIRNGLHDLVLSEKSVRENVYQQLFEWLELKGL